MRTNLPVLVIWCVLTLGLPLGAHTDRANAQTPEAESRLPKTYLDLPPTPVVVTALETASIVKLARSNVNVEEVQRQRLTIGQYEFAARAGFARRHDLSRAYRDAEIALERPVRIG